MKKIVALIGILALAAVVAAPVLAQGPGDGRGRGMIGPGAGQRDACPRYGWGLENLTDEQLSQLATLRQKHFDDTAQVRTQLWAKKAELKILMNTSNPELEKARALQKEITDLQGKMGQERITLYGEAKKINPDLGFGKGRGRGRGLGPCGEGFGPGVGRGWHRGGEGRGPRWN